MNKKQLIDAIVQDEWKMFDNVPNVGGRASCQNDFKTFQIMRSSQAASWSEEVLESYREDLKEAGRSGRNLLTEKYARMMESTSPMEYARIKHLLPVIDPKVVELIGEIVPIVLNWEKELHEKYPHIVQRGRPLFSSEDSPMATSVETYLKGELATYSARTLELYLAHIRQQQSEGINGSALTLLETMKQYGFTSLEEANEKLGSRS